LTSNPTKPTNRQNLEEFFEAVVLQLPSDSASVIGGSLRERFRLLLDSALQDSFTKGYDEAIDKWSTDEWGDGT
jgi:hypothetical protein